MTDAQFAVSSDQVEETIKHFTVLDASGNRRAMVRLARRLEKEQPALLRFAVGYSTEHGAVVGEAAMFYCTLVWAIFDRKFPRKLHRLTQENVDAAREIVTEALDSVEGLADRPVHERFSPALAERQPNIYSKLQKLIEEDVRKDAMSEECAGVIFKPTQVIIEAFDAAVDGRRPGERVGPVVRETPKVGRNEPCPCGSGKKYKKCHGKST